MNGRLVFGSPIDGLLDRLYAKNAAQDDMLACYFSARAAEGSLDCVAHSELAASSRPAHHFGVSTLFLTAAVRDNRRQELQRRNDNGHSCVVIGTESEPEKATM